MAQNLLGSSRNATKVTRANERHCHSMAEVATTERKKSQALQIVAPAPTKAKQPKHHFTTKKKGLWFF